MAKDCCDKNPLNRDGTSQQQRMLKALLPGYVAVDERNINDLIKFVTEYAREIQFYNNQNQKYDNWEKFFLNKSIDKTNQLTEPHYALFIAFLKLFKYAQDDLNKITKKHIDFYYKKVLQLEENPAVADQVFIIFELAKHVSSCKIAKGTKLKAGKDNTGVELTYETDKEIVVNKAQVDELKSVFYNKDNIFIQSYPDIKNDSRIYSSSQSDSSDGEGKDLETEDKSWKTFGQPSFSVSGTLNKIYTANREQAEIGFAFASPNLFLAEGHRRITITLNFSDAAPLKRILNNKGYKIQSAFKVMFSGEKEWIEPIDSDIKEWVENKVLDFINSAQSAKDIAGIEPQEGPVYDDPTTGYGDQIKDYDIGITVAERILTERDKLSSGKFTRITELLEVDGFGQDKLNDLKYSYLEDMHFNMIDIKNKQIIIKRTIFKYQDAIVKYDEDILGDPFETNWPVVKILLNTEDKSNPFIYKDLKDLNITSADIKVDVEEVKNLILQNDFSILDPAKPFQPFTNKPILGSNFYIGSWEVFQKKLDTLSLEFAWQDLPDDDDGFEEYYLYYTDSYDGTNRENQDFKTTISYLKEKTWEELQTKIELFTDEDGDAISNTSQLPIDSSSKIYILASGHDKKVERNQKLEEFKIYDETSIGGFIKLQLNGIDFGHSTYQISYTKAVLIGVEKKEDDYTDSLPNEPYTPTIKDISINYSSKESITTIKVSDKDYKKRIEQFFHVHPFGIEEIKTTNKNNFLVPQIDHEGSLFIGIKDLSPPQSLSLLFKVAEGSADPDQPKQSIEWSYLNKNKWVSFDKDDILSDSTNDLLTSGIIQFSVSKNASDENSILTSGLHWIRACVKEKSKAISDLIVVEAQAITASFKDNSNDPNHLKLGLSANTIKKLKVSNSSIKKISQPYSSFGGKIKEEDNDYYTRISERLRHKARAITIWDYERLTLQQFPSIYKIKCLNHTKYENSEFIEMAPGNVTLIVISNVKNKNDVDPLKPYTGLNTLSEISTFINAICSENVNLFVRNPIYEEVKVDFKVKFHKGYDVGFYKSQLNSDIKEFLAPWAYDTDSDVIFGGRIHKSMILNFVEERDYVDYVTCFKMSLIRYTPDKTESGDLEEAIASTSASVLTSASKHIINELDNDQCDCPDNEQFDITIGSRNNCDCN